MKEVVVFVTLVLTSIIISVNSHNNDILQQQFDEGNYELFPKMRRLIHRFVEIINSPQVQKRIVPFVLEVGSLLNQIDTVQNEEELRQGIQSLAEFLNRKLSSVKAFQQIQKCGFFAFVNDNRFWFLQENIPISDGAEIFLRIWNEEPIDCVNQAFEEYSRSWITNAYRLEWKIQSLVWEMQNLRNNKLLTEKLSDDEFLDILNDIFQYLEPTFNKIQGTVQDRPTKFNAILHIVDVLQGCYQEHEACSNLVKSRVGLFLLSYGNASHKRLNVLNNVSTRNYEERVANQCIEKEFTCLSIDMETCNDSGYTWVKSDVPFIREFIVSRWNGKTRYLGEFSETSDAFSEWFRGLLTKLHNGKGLQLNRFWIMGRLGLVSRLTNGLILKDDHFMNDHDRLTKKMIHYADAITNDVFVNFISANQVRDYDNLQIRFTFILNSSKMAKEVSYQMSQWCDIKHEEIEERKRATLLHTDMDIDKNLTALVSRCVSRLSNLSLKSVLAGTYGLAGITETLKPQFNRNYETDDLEGFPTRPDTLEPDDTPYYRISGWRKIGIESGLNATELNYALRFWDVAYHGTYGHNIDIIRKKGFRSSWDGVYHRKDMPGCVYLTPSIEYAAFPRYAQVWKVGKTYYQMALQVRVRPDRIFLRKGGTLTGSRDYQPTMDPNSLNNSDLEWMIKWPPATFMLPEDGLVVTGIMLRVSEGHPGFLSKCSWWESSRGWANGLFWQYF